MDTLKDDTPAALMRWATRLAAVAAIVGYAILALSAAAALTGCGGGDEDADDGRPGRCVIDGVEYPPERCK